MPPCHGWCFECRKVSGLHTRCLLGGPRQDTVQPQPWRREQGSPLWCTPALLGKRNLWKGFPGSKIRPPTPSPPPPTQSAQRGTCPGAGSSAMSPTCCYRGAWGQACQDQQGAAGSPPSLPFPIRRERGGPGPHLLSTCEAQTHNNNCGGKEPLERKKRAFDFQIATMCYGVGRRKGSPHQLS